MTIPTLNCPLHNKIPEGVSLAIIIIVIYVPLHLQQAEALQIQSNSNLAIHIKQSSSGIKYTQTSLCML
jgi:hypothetical protein